MSTHSYPGNIIIIIGIMETGVLRVVCLPRSTQPRAVRIPTAGEDRSQVSVNAMAYECSPSSYVQHNKFLQ